MRSTDRTPAGPPAQRPGVATRAGTRGSALLEILVGFAILSIATMALGTSTAVGMATRDANHERELAARAARQVLEALDDGSVAFEHLFAAYVPDTATPPPEGTSVPTRSRSFDVPGLQARPDDPDGAVGEIVFPTLPSEAGVQLREDVAGRDLTGDSVQDDADHSGDYRLLPVTVVVRWVGSYGHQELDLHGLLTGR